MQMIVVAALIVVIVAEAASCGGQTPAISRPFTATGGVEGGMGSRLWGDGASGPTGMHLGCIRGRHYALLFTLHNRTQQAVTLLSAGGPQPFGNLLRRVGEQLRLAPPPPSGDINVIGLRRWSRARSQPITVPPGRDAWVQFNYLMGNCALLRSSGAVTLNRGVIIGYRVSGHDGRQRLVVPSARVILSARR